VAKITPRKGDHLYVDTSWGPWVEHHGIYVGDNYIIHFSKPQKGAPPVIDKTSLEVFCGGREASIVPPRSFPPYDLPPDTVVAIAEQILTFQRAGLAKQYSFWKLNCEHFANLCKTGELRSFQMESAAEKKDFYADLATMLGAVFIGI
jgi:Lecithin retinol acyltransferase